WRANQGVARSCWDVRGDLCFSGSIKMWQDCQYSIFSWIVDRISLKLLHLHVIYNEGLLR
ncbi:MAG: hypothetical protein KAQ79_01000, partial [Cyclobacteriaceae bacterium]|nr:hypothetical protein [Cyclobacteriaceae bacterium]